MKLKHSFPFFQVLASYFLPITIDQSSEPYHLELVLSKNKLLLNSSNANQSNDSLERAFHLVFHELEMYNRENASVLILGLGLGSVIDLLQRNSSIQQTTAVENNPQVLAWLELYYDTSSIHLISDSAEKSLQTDEIYDLIIVDLFEDLHIPHFLYQEAFWTQIKTKLTPNGIILWNTLLDYPPQVHFQLENIFDRKLDVEGMNRMWAFYKLQ